MINKKLMSTFYRILQGIFTSAVILISMHQGLAAQQPATNADSMGNEAALILEKRTVDPIKAGKRAIRVLVTYNATNYFVTEGKQAGLEYELMANFEHFLNKGIAADKKYHLIFIALPFKELIPALLGGEGDIIAAGMTITSQRSAKVAFSNPYRANISEAVVRSRKADNVEDAFDLAGKTVHVISGSSYVASLQQLNKELKENRKPSVKIVQADKHLVSEDLLQLVNAGILDYTIVDSHIANLWSKVLEDIIVEEGASISAGSQLGWAVRKDNTALKDKLNIFLKNHKQGTEIGNVLFNRYYKKTKWITNPVSDLTIKRLHEYQKSFMEYGKQYDIDWVMLTALGYQESKLNQNAKSTHGAVGVMQIKPSTAADKNINIKGVEKSYDNNIHAATKYLAFLRSRYFSDPDIVPFEQLAFTLAAYNAGPAKITQMRNKAKGLGLDPNKWFFNVENVTSRFTSKEPVNYVANIMKYHLAFKSIIEAESARTQATEKLK